MGSSGWRSRGYLPHFDSPEKIQHITFHLIDSLPKHALDQIAEGLKEMPEGQRKAERQERLQAWLDSGHGECHLGRPEVAEIVEEALLVGDGSAYRLIEWAIMPNHVHVLTEFEAESEMSLVIKNWKGSTGVACNRLIGRSGSFWYPEYHDRFIRNERHYANVVEYIHMNPVKAGLCESPKDWLFGSARLKN